MQTSNWLILLHVFLAVPPGQAPLRSSTANREPTEYATSTSKLVRFGNVLVAGVTAVLSRGRYGTLNLSFITGTAKAFGVIRHMEMPDAVSHQIRGSPVDGTKEVLCMRKADKGLQGVSAAQAADRSLLQQLEGNLPGYTR